MAYAVGDVRAAALRHTAVFGSGPWFVSDHIELASVTSRGRPAWLDHSSAYGQWGPVMAELICVHDAGPQGLDGVLPAALGLHHVARFVADLASESAALERNGIAQTFVATTAGGVEFAFHDARADLGHFLEIYEPAALRPFYQAVAGAAAGWDGRDPLRPMADVHGSTSSRPDGPASRASGDSRPQPSRPSPGESPEQPAY